MHCESKIRRQTGVIRFLCSLLMHILKPVVERFLCGLHNSKKKGPNISLVYCACFVDRCFTFCTFSFWSLCCLYFFDLRILITHLVSSSSCLDSEYTAFAYCSDRLFYQRRQIKRKYYFDPKIPPQHRMVVTLWLSLNYISLLFLYLSEYKIPSHKYKFKQIFKKIGQINSVDLSYVF